MSLEMHFGAALGVSKKSVFTRLFDLFASAWIANFQAHLVRVTSHFNDKKHLKVERCRKINATIIPQECGFVKYFAIYIQKIFVVLQ